MRIAEEADEIVPIPGVRDRVPVQVAPVGITIEVEHVTVLNGAANKIYKIAARTPLVEYSPS